MAVKVSARKKCRLCTEPLSHSVLISKNLISILESNTRFYLLSLGKKKSPNILVSSYNNMLIFIVNKIWSVIYYLFIMSTTFDVVFIQ